MTAPARQGVPAGRTRSAAKARAQHGSQGERELRRDPERGGAVRGGRSTAAERAYARRASRKQRLLRVVPTRMSGLASRTPFVLMVMGLLAAGVLTTLFLSLSAVSDSYRLEDAKNQVTDLTGKVEALKAEVAKMESPEAVAASARQLGMVPAPDPVRLRQNPDGSVTIVGTASAAPAPPPPPPPPTSSSPPSTSSDTSPGPGGH